MTEVEAAEKAQIILDEFNRILKPDQYKITRKGEEYHLVKENDDLILVGSGGFAMVYRQKSTGLIQKKTERGFPYREKYPEVDLNENLKLLKVCKELSG